MAVSVVERYKKERETAEKRAERALELESIQAQAAILEARVNDAESDRGIEEEIRSRYDVAKEGEQVVIIINDTDDDQDEPQSAPIVTKENSRETFIDKLLFWR